MPNYLARHFPAIASALPVAGLTRAPTPLTCHALDLNGTAAPVLVKHDEYSGELYGGNKVRKLDYILAKARQRGARSVATFGAVGSHHAIATALYAHALGFEAVCLLGHQASTEHVCETLCAHVANGTRIVRYGGNRAQRIATLRQNLRPGETWIVPAGGSSWLGTVGFVNAALELAEQLTVEDYPLPARLYVANGTMGTTAGLALGFALAGLDIEVHAIRVTSEVFANQKATYRLMNRTSAMLHRIDSSFPANLANRVRLCCRHEFVGDGYTRPTPLSDAAKGVAREAFSLSLETTYTAKAFAALLHDLRTNAAAGRPLLFWNTYNAVALPRIDPFTRQDTGLPEDFDRYFPADEESASSDPSR